MEDVNTTHISLLVDRMTYNGTIDSITRYTLRKDDSEPLGKASFEEPMDNFLNASTIGELEYTKGVSASIISGKKPYVGTGSVNIKMDFDNLPDEDENYISGY
jgi:DNA-directed RNA polymerase beta' subunit